MSSRICGARKGVVFGVLLGVLGGTLAAGDAQARRIDRWEKFNRKVFVFNETLDTWALKPVAEFYRTVTPSLVDSAVTAFFDNLSEPRNFVNSVLQLKGDSALVATGRFVFNSTFGLAGLIDVATPMGIERRREDFGQTLGYWGMKSGPYLMLPFLGPSTLRDAAGLGVDFATPGVWDHIDEPENYVLRGVQVVDTRADLIPAEQLMSGDRYVFVRNAYLQRREFMIFDGQPPRDPFADDEDDELMLDDF
ncbi:MAG: VacJ family lipoprotein [Gammaproteobacteria bacterium]|nr:VacJ family lipoprotein [Gammaproteobacteria bacterium]